MVYRERVAYREHGDHYDHEDRYENRSSAQKSKRNPVKISTEPSDHMFGQVVGGVTGALIGSRFGQGNGKAAATVEITTVVNLVGVLFALIVIGFSVEAAREDFLGMTEKADL